jgi:arginase
LKNHFILTPYFLDKLLPGLEAIGAPGWSINKTTLPKGSQQLRMAALYEPLAREVAGAIQDGNRPVSIVGDCCAVLGVAAGLQRAKVDPLLIWFDAHGDFNTWETTPSGFLGGMPLAMLVGRGEQTIPKALGLRPLQEDRVYLTDARDLDPSEKQSLSQSRVTHLVSVEDLIDYPFPPMPIHLHWDVDILDPTVAPAVDYPAPNGPDKAQMEKAFRFLARLDRVVAISVSTWNPERDKNSQTALVCLNLLRTILSS